MRSSTLRLLTPLALVALLGGCNLIKKAGGAPKGQVVATVDGQEITQAELQTELGGNAQAPKALEQAALQRIIARDLLANEAHAQKLDQTPQFAILMQRAKRDLEANLLERKLASEVPSPTKDEADRFVADNPTMFAQRQLIVFDQVQAPPTQDTSLLRALEPLKDLASAEALLESRSIPHQRSMTVVDTLRLDPKLADQIEKAGSSDIFISDTPNGLVINQVKETHPMPFTGDAASQFALRLLANQRSQEAVQKQAHNIITAAADKVKYNANFQPEKPSATPVNPAAEAAATTAAPPPPTAPVTAGQQPFTLGK